MKTSYKLYIAKIIHFFLTKVLLLNKNQLVVRNNISWNLDLDEGIDLAIFLFGKFQNEISQTILRIASKNKTKMIVLDIGSNIGDKSLSIAYYFSKNNFEYFIHSIEPTDFAYYKQLKNLELNKSLSNNIKLHKLYLTNNQKPKSTFSSWNLLKKNTHKIHKGVLKKIGTETKKETLDNFIISNQIKNVKIIKIDVDGHELNILKSGREFIKKQSPFIIMEFAPYALEENGNSVADFFTFLKSINYNAYSLNFKKLEKITIKDGSSIDILLCKDKLNIKL